MSFQVVWNYLILNIFAFPLKCKYKNSFLFSEMKAQVLTDITQDIDTFLISPFYRFTSTCHHNKARHFAGSCMSNQSREGNTDIYFRV